MPTEPTPVIPSDHTGAPAAFGSGRRALFVAAVAVLAVKLVWLAIDRVPLFYMGDSRAYIGSALGWPVLTDRSNTYGWLVRALALGPRSFTPLVVGQTLAGAVTAWLLALLLLRFFKVHAVIAVVAAVVLAAEPLQILYERMVLTETLSLLLLAGYLVLGLSYLHRPRLVMLIAIAATGVLLLSLRLVYVPVTLLNAVLIPSLVWAHSNSDWRARNGAKRFLTHLLVSVLVTLGLHRVYKVANGRAAKLPPAYQYANGFFLAANWAPLIEPEDATDPRARSVVERLLAGGPYPLRSPSARSDHLWTTGGLKAELIDAFGGDRYSANRAAQQMSMRTLRRSPVPIVRSAALDYAGFWRDVSAMRRRLLTEQGSMSELDSTFLATLKHRFKLDAAGIPATRTASKRYHLLGLPWYLALGLWPLVGPSIVVAAGREGRSGALLIFATGVLLLVVPGLVVPTSGLIRSLHPLSLGMVAALAVISNRVVSRSRLGDLGDAATPADPPRRDSPDEARARGGTGADGPR